MQYRPTFERAGLCYVWLRVGTCVVVTLMHCSHTNKDTGRALCDNEFIFEVNILVIRHFQYSPGASIKFCLSPLHLIKI